MTYSDGHPSSAPVDKEQNDVRLTAAKTRANDRRTRTNRRTRSDRLARKARLDRVEARLATLDAICTRLEATIKAPTIQEHHEARLAAAKPRANDVVTEANLEAIQNSFKKAIQETTTRLEAKIKAAFRFGLSDVPAEEDALDQTAVQDAEEAGEDVSAEEVVLAATVERDNEEPGADVEEPGEDTSAEEVVLDTTVDRGDEEPGEDASPDDVASDRTTARGNADPRDDTLTTDVVLDPIEVRDDEELGEEAPGEEERLPTNDPSNFDDTVSEDGIVPKPVANPAPPPASTPFRLKVNTVSGPKSNHDHKPELTFTSPPTTAPDQPSDNYDREWLQTSPPPDPNAPEPSKPRSTPTNAPDQPSANYDQEWLQTSPPPDPPVPTPKRESRNRQSTDYHTPAAHIHVQIYGYPPYGFPLSHNGHDGSHSNVYMDSDSEDSPVTTAMMLPMEAITVMGLILTNTSSQVATIIAVIAILKSWDGFICLEKGRTRTP
ncbi:hypothetical protein THAOC_01411 [Thalassiosira oceanica]|uniref:Uncharacterized protein n=1 Tax=Thalassiosira oceanica TaxID=159749 RepID=K0TQX5_THAOC|nr:hypothetical protein THAOC_01411 [Thalassiosira oceanica]|eukprot:EJK76807.1 hypothetical protein THAOC_01411 [Thalassiosira oceanica]